MKFFRNNIRIIVLLTLVIILASSISAFATYNYFAKDITYVTSDGMELSVEEALNDLYNNHSNNVILSISQISNLTTSFKSTTSPNYYNNSILNYNSENNTYTFLQDFSGILYVAHGWIQGHSACKFTISVNGSNVVNNKHIEGSSSAFNYSYDFKAGDVLKFYSKLDFASSIKIPISINLLKK